MADSRNVSAGADEPGGRVQWPPRWKDVAPSRREQLEERFRLQRYGPRAGCPTCWADGEGEGPGYLPNGALCSCVLERAKEREARRLVIGLPPAYANIDLDRWPLTDFEPQVREQLADYVANFDPAGAGLLLMGGPGRGKTIASVAITKALRRRGFTVAWWDTHDLLNLLRRAVREYTYDDELVPALQSADLLVLDDLGAQTDTDWGGDELRHIFNRREQHGHPCLVTTNVPERELLRSYGDRMVSRLFGRSGGPLVMTGTDWRRQNAGVDQLGEIRAYRQEREPQS